MGTKSMKVRMRKFESFYSTRAMEDRYFKLRHDKYPWQVKEEDYDRLDKFVLKVLDICQDTVCHPLNLLSRFKRKIFKRVYVKIDRWDAWNADDTLCYIIAPLLKELKNQKQSAAFVDDEDAPEHLHSNLTKEQKENHDIDDNWFARWNWVLDEMIWCFENLQTDWEEKYYSGKSDVYFEKLDNGYSTMKHGPNHTFKVDDEGIKKERERMDNALRLFGKYYFNLWS